MGGTAWQMEHNAKQVAALLRVLANQHRLQVLCLLIEQPQTVGSLAKKIGSITQPALSQHLALLKAHNIVSSKRGGQSNTYSIADPRVEELIALLKTNYCHTGQPVSVRSGGHAAS